MAIMARSTKLQSGYKRTELGVIPEDWEVKPLVELTTLLTNGFVGKATNFYTDSDDGIIYIQGFNVEENSYNLTGIKRVTLKFHRDHQKSFLYEGDLLTIQTGEIGLTTIVPKELEGSNCHALIISRFNKTLDSKYFSYYFNSFKGRTRFREIETGSIMKHLNVGDLRTWLVPFPPTKSEQTTIATVLSDVDALITSLDKLIAKKRDIKQATMQQLLTGKMRLPGFSGGGSAKLGDFLELRLSRTHLSQSDLATFIGMEDVSESGYIINQNVMPLSSIKKGLTFFERDDILVAKITPCFENGKGACLDTLKTIVGFGSTEFHVLRAKKNAIPRYIFYQTQAIDFRQQLESEMIGTAGQKRVPIRAIKDYVLPLFHSKKEQQAIATILSDMDAEIVTLEQRRDKTRALKQGMMQELLTGKTRLL